MLTAEHGQQQLGATPTAFVQRLAHRRQPGERGDLDVVEADHRQVVGNAQAGVGRRFQDTQRLEVGGGEDRGRTLVEAKQRARGLPRLLAPLRPREDVLGPEPDACSNERALVAARCGRASTRGGRGRTACRR